jgi:hypothetical protein
MKYYLVEPEVMVDLGSDTIFEMINPPIKTIKSLHIELESWMGDDLLTNHPVFIVTENLKKSLEISDFSGFTFDKMKVTKGKYFENGYDLKKSLPNFHWLKINGQPNIDDFYILNYELYISERILEFLKLKFQIDNMDINRPKDEFDDFIDKL